MKKNLVRKILPVHYTTWTAPAGVEEVIVTVLDKFNQLAAGGISSSYILKKTGAVFAAGQGTSGELGDGTIVAKNTYVPVGGGHSFVQIEAGNLFATALKADGSAWAWGLGTSGQLGDNTILSKSVPIVVAGSHSFIYIGASQAAGHAIKVDGSVWSWGSGPSGQLGDGTVANKSSPVPVVGGHSFIQLAGFTTTVLALKANGEAWSWGSGTLGQLGNNAFGVIVSSPVQVVGGHSFIQVSMGATHGTALKEDGSVWCWGSNSVGQLGNNQSDPGGLFNRSSPVQVVGGHSFIKIDAASAFTMALKADGSAWGWGANVFGQLGQGNTTPQTTSSPVPVAGGHSFADIGAGHDWCIGVKRDGTIFSWGQNANLQLADNTIASSRSIPVQAVGAIGTFEAGVQYANRRIFSVTPGTTYNINGFLTQIGSQTMTTNTGNNVYIVLEYYA